MRYSITPCTSTSTRTREQNSPKWASKNEKGLVFTRLFQLRLRRASQLRSQKKWKRGIETDERINSDFKERSRGGERDAPVASRTRLAISPGRQSDRAGFARGKQVARLRQWRQRRGCFAFCNRVCSPIYERSSCVSRNLSRRRWWTAYGRGQRLWFRGNLRSPGGGFWSSRRCADLPNDIRQIQEY